MFLAREVALWERLKTETWRKMAQLDLSNLALKLPK